MCLGRVKGASSTSKTSCMPSPLMNVSCHHLHLVITIMAPRHLQGLHHHQTGSISIIWAPPHQTGSISIITINQTQGLHHQADHHLDIRSSSSQLDQSPQELHHIIKIKQSSSNQLDHGLHHKVYGSTISRGYIISKHHQGISNNLQHGSISIIIMSKHHGLHHIIRVFINEPSSAIRAPSIVL